LFAAALVQAETVEVTAGDSVPRDALGAFREALTEVHLSSPSPVPGESTPHDFLSDAKIVGAVADIGGGPQ
jgi:hypothetical protein